MVGAESDAVISETQSQTHGGVPTMRPGDQGVVDIIEWGFDLEATVRCTKQPVVGEVDAISALDTEYGE